MSRRFFTPFSGMHHGLRVGVGHVLGVLERRLDARLEVFRVEQRQNVHHRAVRVGRQPLVGEDEPVGALRFHPLVEEEAVFVGLLGRELAEGGEGVLVLGVADVQLVVRRHRLFEVAVLDDQAMVGRQRVLQLEVVLLAHVDDVLPLAGELAAAPALGVLVAVVGAVAEIVPEYQLEDARQEVMPAPRPAHAGDVGEPLGFRSLNLRHRQVLTP